MSPALGKQSAAALSSRSSCPYFPDLFSPRRCELLRIQATVIDPDETVVPSVLVLDSTQGPELRPYRLTRYSAFTCDKKQQRFSITSREHPSMNPQAWYLRVVIAGRIVDTRCKLNTNRQMQINTGSAYASVTDVNTQFARPSLLASSSGLHLFASVHSDRKARRPGIEPRVCGQQANASPTTPTGRPV
ncbi:hypothetical protein T265_07975 [Opisthorchis viverrini]|uniref:Uncharacterized protein n=1 Tax=Opisthorchis viverrini TaxID=6198 RepID=A0A074ZLU7_OPIVI|nr:hypothetical protein T265_07975 [Opisthorchis viverrini]KER24335.1 hypothetical protein T265_07975 [Opisthorchis viverrini]